MSVDERTRHEMYSGLEEKLGTSVADALMAHLPPSGWADVARTQDLDSQAILSRRDLDTQTELLRNDLERQSALVRRDLEAQTELLRNDLERQIELVRRDLEAQTELLRHDLEEQMALLRHDLERQIDSVRHDLSTQTVVLRSEMLVIEERLGARIHAESNRMLFFMIPTMLTTIGLSLAASRLG